MATKREEQSFTTTFSTGEETTTRILSFVTVEDYIDLATLSQINVVRNGGTYSPNLLPRSVRDTFLRLRIGSGLAEVESV